MFKEVPIINHDFWDGSEMNLKDDTSKHSYRYINWIEFPIKTSEYVIYFDTPKRLVFVPHVKLLHTEEKLIKLINSFRIINPQIPISEMYLILSSFLPEWLDRSVIKDTLDDKNGNECFFTEREYLVNKEQIIKDGMDVNFYIEKCRIEHIHQKRKEKSSFDILSAINQLLDGKEKITFSILQSKTGRGINTIIKFMNANLEISNKIMDFNKKLKKYRN